MTLPLTASYPPEIHGVTLTSFSYVLIFFTLFGLCTTVVILLRMIRNIVRLIRIRQQSRKQAHIDSLFDSPHVRKEAGDGPMRVGSFWSKCAEDERSYNKYLADTQKEPERVWMLSPQYGRDMHKGLFVEAICPHGMGHHKGVHGCHPSDKESPVAFDGYEGCCSTCPPDLWAQVTDDDAPKVACSDKEVADFLFGGIAYTDKSKRTVKKNVKKSKV